MTVEHEDIIRARITVGDLHEALAEWLHDMGLDIEKAGQSVIDVDFSLLDSTSTRDLVLEEPVGYVHLTKRSSAGGR